MATGPCARARGGATAHAICRPHLLLPEDRCRHPPRPPRGRGVTPTSVGVGGPVGSQEGTSGAQAGMNAGTAQLRRPPPAPAPACRGLHAPRAHQFSSGLACRPGALIPPGVGPSVVTVSLRASGTGQDAAGTLMPLPYTPALPHQACSRAPTPCAQVPSSKAPHPQPCVSTSPERFCSKNLSAKPRCPQTPSQGRGGQGLPSARGLGVAVTGSIRTPSSTRSRWDTTARKQVLVLRERPLQGGCREQAERHGMSGRTTQRGASLYRC